jgi:Ser/Thr protein kinase RdoA (MazF antagonist)
MPDGQTYYVVIFAWIQVAQPDLKTDLIPSFRRLGRITAQLHRHSRTWRRPAWFQRQVWDHEGMIGVNGHWGHWQNGLNVRSEAVPTIADAVSQIAHDLREYGQDDDRFGLIHADLRLTNLLLDGDQTRVIDFDDCGFSWFMHDLAAAMGFHEHHPDVPEWAESWLAGYAEVNALSKADRAVIPGLIVQRRLQLLAWSGTHADTETAKACDAQWFDDTVSLCDRYLGRRFLANLV